MKTMLKERIFYGIGIIIFGVLTAFGPRTIFPVCEFAATSMKMESTAVMVCHYTAQTELGFGIVLIIIGVFAIVLAKNRNRLFGIALAVFPLGILVVGIPNGLIGVCQNPHATCSMMTRPALTVLGVLLIAVDLVLSFLFRKDKKEA